MKYCFFYDETEHNRKINYNTITANNYYDNFTTAIVGVRKMKLKFVKDIVILKPNMREEK